MFLTTDRNYYGVKADSMAANAAVVWGSAGASGEVANASSTVFNDTTGVYRALATSVVNGNVAGWNQGALGNGPTVNPSPQFTAHLKLGSGTDITNCRIWIAISDGDITGSADPNTNNVLGFHYDTGIHITPFWRLYSCNGSGGSRGPTTPVPITASTSYIFKVQMPGYVMSINGITCSWGPLGVLQPTSAAKLAWTMTITNLTGVARTLNCGFFTIDHL